MKVARVLNWALLGLFTLSIGIAIQRHVATVLVFIALLPFAAALLSFRGPPKVWFMVITVILNAIYALIGLGGLVYSAAGHAAVPGLAAIACLLFLIPCCLNATLLVLQLAEPPRAIKA